ncbi:MAG: sulfatase-like hydrolase/transferase [Deltaproteobacteria bacterium]|nr:sulfatase-like hydrolase/transferase [Deltaproteobacteria bacterium]
MLARGALVRAAKACVLAGLIVGLCDGARVAWPLGLSAGGVVTTIALSVAIDGFLGGVLGAAVFVLFGVYGWGGVGHKTWPARLALLTLGLGAGFAGAGGVWLTASRVNRFLAAGVVVDLLLLSWLGVWLFAPALSRVFGGGRAATASPTTSSLVGRWWLAPLTLGVACLATLVIVWRTRAPLRGPALWERAGWVFAVGMSTPWLVKQAAAWGASARLRPLVVKATAIATLAAATVVLMALRWEKDFQYLPWTDVLVAAALVAVAWLCYRWLVPRLRFTNTLVLGWILCVPLAVWASSSEVARKALAARGGLVGPTLTASMRAFDRDHDGYARLMGGGDCDDGDPEINPGALDWPDDGLDQDCDGTDAVWQALQSPPFHVVPPTVPANANILFVAIDTLRADHLGGYGYARPTSPNLDALGKEGVVFENGWAHAPSTRFSMPAIFTGRWPSTVAWEDCNTCRSWWPRIAASQPMLPGVLKQAGFFTGALWAYSYFDADERRGFERGVDVYDSRRGALHTNVAGPAESVGSSASQITDDAVAFVNAHKDQRFYLSVHYYDPHMSYEPHAESPAFGRAPGDLYDGEVWFTDHHIGRLFEAVKAQGLWDRTIVVVTGDHGEGLGERGITAHGYHLYPPQTKVPFIMRVPGLPPHREATPVSHVDLAPTIANLVGAAHQPTFLGRSFVDLLAGKPNNEVAFAPVFQEVTYEGDNKKRALVTATHQLIWNWTPHNTTECYALNDPSGRDLWGTPAGEGVCPTLKAKLRQRVALLALPNDAREKISNDVFGPGRQAPAPKHPSAGRIGDAIAVQGYDVDGDTFVRGAAVPVSIYFHVNQRVPEGWKLFFHLDGPPGGARNLDHAPVGGAFSVERWRPGQTVRDQNVITLDPTLPPGRYVLYVGLWRGNERQPVFPPERSDGNNRLKVLEFTVN